MKLFLVQRGEHQGLLIKNLGEKGFISTDAKVLTAPFGLVQRNALPLDNEESIFIREDRIFIRTD